MDLLCDAVTLVNLCTLNSCQDFVIFRSVPEKLRRFFRPVSIHRNRHVTSSRNFSG